MFYSVNDFLGLWMYESGATQNVLNQLTDESLQQEITPENWSLGRVAWHITTAIRLFTAPTELNFVAAAEDFPVPRSAKFIADSYAQSCEAFFEAMTSQWNDETLHEIVDFFGQEMPIGQLLMIMIQHQIHHRGQMTVLMRQAGLNVPGIYGPSKEEWAMMGLDAPQM
ncbi:DinB family protein [Bacillus sp. CGMCC 1.16607]|uniref:DinB family protein n=1 Tax=Bacillus sp. CGMCC 1.16607 TaxID=3351842 RepID=UPI00362BB701